ncbi:MAG TPA: metallophosphoesterase [Gemmatimonadales bacterium]|nr:metallophosphoesterase [Gemmatimonadales bacterium]
MRQSTLLHRRRPLLGYALLLTACASRIVPPAAAPAAEPGDIVASVILIGDAGAPKAPTEPVLTAVARELSHRPDTAAILFLGDNVYPRGLPDSAHPSYAEAARRLRAQLELASEVPVFLVPGNHDWDKSGTDGLARIRHQGVFVARASGGRARLLPADGCPGPEVADIGSGLRLVLLDTEWWLFPHDKPGETSRCPTRTRAEVIASLKKLLEGSRGRQVIVAGHHPLESGGPHGGYFPVVDHLFPLRKLHPALFVPLPIIGTIYPAARGQGISAEDVNGGPYRVLRASLDSAFACAPPAIYAAGHEHTLQVIDRGRPPMLVVSGAGIYGHESHVEGIPGTRVALGDPGFMRVDLLRDGRLRLGVVTVDRNGRGREVYAERLPVQPMGGACPSR